MKTSHGIAILLLGLLSLGCATQPVVSTQSTGSHMAWSEEEWRAAERGEKKPKRFVVWGDHQIVTSTIMSSLQSAGHGVIERARLQDIFNEQKIVLTHSSDDYSTVFRVGKLLGANIVIFGESVTRAMPLSAVPRDITVSERLLGMSAGGGNPGALQLLQQRQEAANRLTAYQLSVAIRAVDVESGEVRWSGGSHLSQPVTDPESALVGLTTAAMGRALCPIERGAKWTEFSSDKPNEPWGCSK